MSSRLPRLTSITLKQLPEVCRFLTQPPDNVTRWFSAMSTHLVVACLLALLPISEVRGAIPYVM
ncbi:MAG: hypothetical protein QXF91_06530, partial [Desulfurococcaceae archaeon]